MANKLKLRRSVGTCRRCRRPPRRWPLNQRFSCLPGAYLLHGGKSDEKAKPLNILAHPTRFERVTFAFGGQRSCCQSRNDLFYQSQESSVASLGIWTCSATFEAVVELRRRCAPCRSSTSPDIQFGWAGTIAAPSAAIDSQSACR